MDIFRIFTEKKLCRMFPAFPEWWCKEYASPFISFMQHTYGENRIGFTKTEWAEGEKGFIEELTKNDPKFVHRLELVNTQPNETDEERLERETLEHKINADMDAFETSTFGGFIDFKEDSEYEYDDSDIDE